MRLAQLEPAARTQARLLFQFSPGRPQRVFAGRAAAFGYLPGVAFERVAILPDQVERVFLDGQDADGEVLEMDDTVDARLSVGSHHLVFTHADPGVVVNLPRGQTPPGFSEFF